MANDAVEVTMEKLSDEELSAYIHTVVMGEPCWHETHVVPSGCNEK